MGERAKAELALVAVTLVWGVTFVLVKNALDQVSTLLFLALRFGLAAVALTLLFRNQLSAGPELRRSSLTGGVLAGLCLFAAYFFQTMGLRFTTPSKSAFLTGLSAALVPFFGAIVYQKAPHVSEVIGVTAATAGLALLALPPGALQIGLGDALTIGCAVTFAMHILVLGYWTEKSHLALLSVSQIGVTALLALLTFPWAEQAVLKWTTAVAGAVVVTGVFATAVAFTVQAWAQRHTTPTRAALIFALEPVAAAVTSYVWEGELLKGRGLAGAAMILGGVLLVELKPIGGREHPSA